MRLIRRENIGFSAANNVVLREDEAAAVLLLNPDTEVYAGTLDAALARLRSEPRIGMVGCKLVTESASSTTPASAPSRRRSAPSPTSPASAAATAPGRRSASTGRPTSATTMPGEVDAVNGAFMLCRAEAVREVGLLDEGYWLYMEDLDWCRRFWQAGWKVFYEPAGVALHVKGGSSGKRRRPKQEIAFHRGMGRFYRRFDAASTTRSSTPRSTPASAPSSATSLGITAVRGR